MALSYNTRAGDTVDYIAWKYYGSTTHRIVEKLLNANRGLADAGAVLPAGITVHLPDIDTTEKTQGIRLWD